MGKTAEHSRGSTSSAPNSYPQTTPQAFAPADHSFTLQSIMEMQKTLGQLSQAVTNLTEESKKSRETLEGVSRDILTAKASMKVAWWMLTIVGGVVAVLFWKIWDAIIPLIQLKPHL